MRITLAGTPQSLYRLRKANLPTDRDLTHSHLYYVNADGFDLTDYNCDWMDWVHCSARGTAIPEGAPHLYSYKTDWTDAPLPRDFHHLNRDFLVEAMKQQARKSVGADATILFSTASHPDDNMGGSWVTAVPELIRQGHAAEDVLRVTTEAFAPFPNAAHRLSELFKHRNWKDTLFEVVSPHLNVVSPDGGRIYIPDTLWPDKLKGLWRKRDRWATARAAEVYLDATIPKGAPWAVIIINFEPRPAMSVEPTIVGLGAVQP